jgi:hypothetical protein
MTGDGGVGLTRLFFAMQRLQARSAMVSWDLSAGLGAVDDRTRDDASGVEVTQMVDV